MGFRTREVDLHGLYADEVEYTLANVFSECKAYGISELNIVYGKGAGILKQRVLSVLTTYQKLIISKQSDDVSVKISLRLRETKARSYKKKASIAKAIAEDKSYLDGLIEKKRQGKEKYLKRVNRS